MLCFYNFDAIILSEKIKGALIKFASLMLFLWKSTIQATVFGYKHGVPLKLLRKMEYQQHKKHKFIILYTITLRNSIVGTMLRREEGQQQRQRDVEKEVNFGF